MRRVMVGVIAAVGLAGLTAGTTATRAQHAHGGAGAQGHQVAQTCASEFEKVVGEGRGFGLAFAADQNGYPGPMHVLSPGSRPKGARLLDAEARLRRLFAERVADAPAVRAAVAEVERARTEVRLVHLLTHLTTRNLLTEDQRRIYHEARWGAIAPARIERAILLIRDHRVMLDADLAVLYGVATKRLAEQVRRNSRRFPADFMFRLTAVEARILRSRIATSSFGRGWGGRRYAP